MSETTGVELMNRALDFFSRITESDPAPVSSFTTLDLTGDQAADMLLSQISRMMLQQLKSDGMINADDLSKPGAKIYGLTKQGVEMRSLFLKLSHE